MDKNKIYIGVAAALGIAAVAYVVYSNSQATAANDQASAGAFPSLMFTAGTSASPSPVSAASTGMTDTSTAQTAAPGSSSDAINAALNAAALQIEASKSIAYNASATDLFKALPADLAAADMQGFTATQSQDASGTTSLNVNAVYRSSATPAAASNYLDSVFGALAYQGEYSIMNTSGPAKMPLSTAVSNIISGANVPGGASTVPGEKVTPLPAGVNAATLETQIRADPRFQYFTPFFSG